MHRTRPRRLLALGGLARANPPPNLNMKSSEILQIIRNTGWQKFLTRPYGLAFVRIHALAYHSELKHIVGPKCCTLYIAKNGLVDIYRNKKSADEIKNNFYNLVLNKQTLIQTIKIIKWHRETTNALDCEHFIDKKQCAKYFAHLTVLPFNIGNAIIENKLHDKCFDYKKILSFLESVRCLNYFHKFGKHNQQTSNDFVYFIIGNRAYFTYHQRVVGEIANHLSPPKITADMVRGHVAYPGAVIGEVVIIKNTKDIKKISPGNILMAHSTNPELLPAMRIAGAIVTDEGGLMSHAAILARELKIPCIIGTKCATRVFKDGEVVEVDGADGVVRKYCPQRGPKRTLRCGYKT